MIPFGGLLRQVKISEAHIQIWKFEFSREFVQWLETLSEKEQKKIEATFQHVQFKGPDTKRPYVGLIRGSSFHKMKELRVSKGIRILFIIDEGQVIVVLLGGDKSEQEDTTPNWNRWYRKMVPIADQIFINYKNEQGESK